MSTLGNNLLAQYYAQQEALPSEYRRVEYLECTWLQWIDTNIPSTNNIWEVKFQFLSLNINQLMGASNVSTRFNFGIERNSASFFSFAYDTWSISSTPVDTLPHVFRLCYNDASFSVDNGIKEYNSLGAIQGATVCIFNRKETQTGFQVKSGRCYYSKILNANLSLIQNLIPCVRKSDNKPGMYDLCKSICPLTGTPFYINAGTGEFVIPT